MNQQDQFTNLYNEYSEGIRKLCLGYTGDAMLAQDLLQETFIAVWNNMQQFRADAKWSTWIYRIAVNTCLTHLRKKTATLVDIETTSLACSSGSAFFSGDNMPPTGAGVQPVPRYHQCFLFFYMWHT